MLQAGTRLNDRYEIQSVLGEGGMGFVYLALDSAKSDEKVAVKEMAVHLHSEEEKPAALRQFRVEAELLGSLQHPRLAPVRDFFEQDDNAYLVMSFIDGQTLAAATAEREVPVTEIAGWIDQICEVLEYLHGHEPPVLFCDLKPSNVMVDRDGQIWLIDFGIARAVKTEQGSSTFLKGAVTAAFAPLEQFSGKGTDARSDIYSLGATMYNLLTGERPPISVDVVGGESAPAAPRTVNASIPLEVEAIVCKAMALRKEDRYQSIQELRCDLSEVRALLESGGLAEVTQLAGGAGSVGRPGSAPPPPQQGVRRTLSPFRRPLWFVTATVAAILWLLMAPRAATPGETHVSFTERLTPRASHAPVVTAPASIALSEPERPASASAQRPVSTPDVAAAHTDAPRPRQQKPAAKRAPAKASPTPTAPTARAIAEDEPPEEPQAPLPTRVPRPVAQRHTVEVEPPTSEEHRVEIDEKPVAERDQRTADGGQLRQRFTNPYAPSAEALASIPPPPHVRNLWTPCTDTMPALKPAPPKPALRKRPRSTDHGQPPPAAPSAVRTKSLDLLGVVVSQRGKTALVRIGNDFRYVGLGSRLGTWTVVEFNCRPPYKSDLVVQSNGVSRRVPLVPATADAGVPRPPTADEVPITGPAPAPPTTRPQPLEPPVDPRYFRP